jgi:hypothetical protein
VSVEEFQRRRISALPLLLLAAVDLVIALLLLVGSGPSASFFAIFLIGLTLAAIGLFRVYRRPPPTPEDAAGGTGA